MFDPKNYESRVEISAFRYWFAVSAMMLLVIVLTNQVLNPENVGSLRVFLAVFALLIAAALLAFFRRGRDCLVLTDDGIVTGANTMLCRIEDIEKVDGGAFAFKPSKGFLIHLKEPAPSGWHPGLWWRYGRKLGIGGLTSSKQTGGMVTLLQLHLTPKEAFLDEDEDEDRPGS